MTGQSIIQLILLIMILVMVSSANSGDLEKSKNIITSEQQIEKIKPEKKLQGSKTKKTRSDFIPSEKIEADTAVPFPVDI